MDGMNGAGAPPVRIATILPGCGDPEAAERIVQNANAATEAQVVDRRAAAGKPAWPPSALERLLAAPGPLDRFRDPDRSDRA